MINDLCVYIWEHAAILEELSSDHNGSNLRTLENNLPKELLDSWREHSCAGNQVLFEHLLDARIKLKSRTRPYHAVNRSRWGRQLKWIIDAINFPLDPTENYNLSNSVPFFHIIEPLIIASRARLITRLGSLRSSGVIISDNAIDGLQTELREKISNISAPILFEAFLISKSQFEPSNTADAYDQFLSKFSTRGLKYIVKQYPVLFRIICVICDQWIVTNAEFLRRFVRDKDLICKTFMGSSKLKLEIIAIQPNLGDPHNQGRSVRRLDLSSGVRILYKPRSLHIDEVWGRLISFFNLSSPSIHLRFPQSLNRGRYGWSEFIEHSACKDSSEFSVFYERIGAWLFLLYVFSATDIHEENIVANGSHPVPIDLELTLQQHEGLKKDLFGRYLCDTAVSEAERCVSDSVLATGLLPAFGRDIDDSVYKASGLGIADLEEDVIEWDNVNTGEMTPRLVKANKAIRTNVPFISNQFGEYEKYHASIQSGFLSYSSFFIQKKDSCEFKRLFNNFSRSNVRTLMKPTRFYAHLLRRATDFRELKNGVLWGLMLRFTDRFVSWGCSSEFQDAWVSDREYESLLAISVPSFSMSASTTELASAGKSLPDYFVESGFDSVKRRVESLGNEGVVEQVELIQLVFKSESIQSKTQTPVYETFQSSQTKKNIQCFDTNAHLRKLSDTVFIHLQNLAIRRNNTSAWIGFDWLGDTTVPQLSPLGQDLYNGAGGIALFLAAYGVTLDQADSVKLSYEAISPLRRLVQSNHAEMYARKIGAGLGAGVGSVIYTLTSLSEILQDSALLDEAIQFSKVIDRRFLELDSSYDLIGGSAGCLISLLKCYSISNNEHILMRARMVADYLCEKSVSLDRIGKLWISGGMGPSPLTGMSHGASGFAYAFSYLYSFTSDPKYLEMRNHCLDFEQSCFDSIRNTWPDLREVAMKAEISWPSQWCHGSTGIGFSRLAMLTICKQNEFRLISDLEAAVNATKAAWPYSIDTVCCGTAGNSWFLFDAARYFGIQELSELAVKRFITISQNSASGLGFRWTTIGSEKHNLGFFRGVAGIGYTSIRLMGAKLPNILVAG